MARTSSTRTDAGALRPLLFRALWTRLGRGERLADALATAADDASARQRRVLRRLLRALDASATLEGARAVWAAGR